MQRYHSPALVRRQESIPDMGDRALAVHNELRLLLRKQMQDAARQEQLGLLASLVRHVTREVPKELLLPPHAQVRGEAGSLW